MSAFFEAYFPDVNFDRKETAVCCPFDHFTAGGMAYREQNPSAHINREHGVFHCKVCGQGLSEVAFLSRILHCSYEESVRLIQLFEKHADQTVYTWEQDAVLPDNIRELAHDLGIKDAVIEELKLKSMLGDDLAFPVFMYGVLLDVRSYRPQGHHKIKSQSGAVSGLILPFDLWIDSDPARWTLICAGEKDMAVARSHGFNAITITGGEGALPKGKEVFRNRKVAIVYDNDDAGISGARRLAAYLHEVTEDVRVVTGFHEVCQQKGEDITDFFVRYHRNARHLIEYIQNAPSFTEEEVNQETEKLYPTLSLLEASKPQYLNRMVRSNIQVVATFEASYSVPTTIIGQKIQHDGAAKGNQMQTGEERIWYLTENTAQDILKLVDNNFTEKQIRENTRDLLRIMQAERNIKITRPTKETVFKCSVTDLFETGTKLTSTIEYTAYVVGIKLESGKKYKALHKLVPHPYKGAQLIMIITDVEDAADSVSNFKLTETVKQNLDQIRNLPGTVTERVDLITQKVKGLLGYDGNDMLIQTVDFSFHTVLEFHFGMFKNVRGYLDTLIVGESRVGKSSTATTLCDTYHLGVFTSLAGNSATIAGLVGGSNKVNGGYQTRAGLIPQNHRGLVIFEEFGKSPNNVAAELTDIRSSNEVRITRVSGTLTLPALVRMITLSNVKAYNGVIKPINSYPNGIEIVTELVGTAEDIARYDLILISGYTGDKPVDPFWEPEPPFSPEVYQTRIRWVWSREPEQVQISKEVGHYIIEMANYLNKEYKTHIKIFGTEAWKKITRLAIAVAGYLVSTDETYQNIIVKEEHVDYAVRFLVDLYDNDTFKLKEYVEHERRYSEIDEDGIALLQDMFIAYPSLLLHLEQNSRTQRQTLMAATGLSNEDFNRAIHSLVRALCLTFNKNDIVPTERFRKGMKQINRTTAVQRLGEPQCNSPGTISPFSL